MGIGPELASYSYRWFGSPDCDLYSIRLSNSRSLAVSCTSSSVRTWPAVPCSWHPGLHAFAQAFYGDAAQEARSYNQAAKPLGNDGA